MNANVTMIRVRKSLAALAVLSGIALADIAAAENFSNEPLTAVVSYADLNLGKEAGATALYRRLQGAARQVCAPLNSGRLRLNARWRECIDQAIARAVERIDAPMLTAQHLSKQRKADTQLAVAER